MTEFYFPLDFYYTNWSYFPRIFTHFQSVWVHFLLKRCTPPHLIETWRSYIDFDSLCLNSIPPNCLHRNYVKIILFFLFSFVDNCCWCCWCCHRFHYGNHLLGSILIEYPNNYHPLECVIGPLGRSRDLFFSEGIYLNLILCYWFLLS